MSSRLASARGLALPVAVVLVAALVVFAGPTAGQSGATVEIHDVGSEVVQVDEVVTIEYTANGSGITDDDVTLVFEHPRGHEVAVDGQAGAEISQDVDIEPFELDPGPYDLRVEIDGGPTAEKERAIEVAPLYDPDDANFETTESSTDGVVANYAGPAGDFVTVSVGLDDLDEAYVIVGGDRAADDSQAGAPLDILHVDGSATFTINTRLVGTDRPSDEVYIPVDGDVTSYAHHPEFDPDESPPPSSVFDGLYFENEEYDQIADNLTAFRAAANSGEQVRPLQPGSDIALVVGGGDSVVVTEEGLPDARFPLDRANVALSQPGIANVTTYQLPTGNADEREFALDPGDIDELEPGDIDGLLDDATKSDTLARTDRLLIEAEATGLYGALADTIDGSDRIESDEPALVDPAEFGALFDLPEGIGFEVEHVNRGPNEPPTSVDLFEARSHEVSIILDSAFGEEPTETDRFYVLVDTRELDPFDPEPDGGSEFEVQMSYTPPPEAPYRFTTVQRGTVPDPFDPMPQGPVDIIDQYPYLLPGDGVAEQRATFTVEERFVEYDRTTGDGEVIVADDLGASISGTTNLAPGTDLPVNIVLDVRDDPTTVEIEGVDIDEDGQFAVTADLSMLEPGEEVDVQFWAYQEKLDERPAAVVDSDDVGGNFELTDLSAESVVTVDGTFVELSAVVTNTGLLADNGTVELVLDNEVVANRTLDLEPGETRVLHFEDAVADLDPGQYPLVVRTPDDRDGLMLVVDEAEGVFEVTDIDAAPTVVDGEPAVDFETTVRNTGTINESATIELLRDGEVVAERTADLLTGQDVTYTFAEELAGLPPDNYTLTVRTPDDERSVEVTVEAAEALLELDDVDVATTVEQGETISPTALVNNTGLLAGSGDVTATFDGDVLDASTVDLEPAENATVAFAETTVDADPGAYALRVETPDDEVIVEIIVEEEQGDEEDQSDEGSGDGEGSDNGPGGLFAVGFGRGAVVAGTALVAGVHVLGYWV